MLCASLHGNRPQHYNKGQQAPSRTVQTLISGDPKLVLYVALFAVCLAVGYVWRAVQQVRATARLLIPVLRILYNVQFICLFQTAYLFLLGGLQWLDPVGERKLGYVKKLFLEPYELVDVVQDKHEVSCGSRTLYVVVCLFKALFTNTTLQVELVKQSFGGGMIAVRSARHRLIYLAYYVACTSLFLASGDALRPFVRCVQAMALCYLKCVNYLQVLVKLLELGK